MCARQPSKRHGMESDMRRKPDLIWILVLVFTFGVVTTGYTQSYFDRSLESGPATPVAAEAAPDR